MSAPRLFAYGTLLPGDVRWHVLEPFVVDEGTIDRAAGRLFDTGCDYPAAVFGTVQPAHAEPAGRRPLDVIHGRVFQLRTERSAEALAVLDDVEGAVAGDYRRVEIATAAGHIAWAYAYGGGLELDPIVGGSWQDHRARLARG